MKLKKILLKNFRQFYGDQVIELANTKNKNVTLIHAENGVGKTTLLNSIMWTFFGDVTKKFEGKDKIINFAAVEEGETVARVEVYFEHENVDYLAQRIHRSKNNGRCEEAFNIFRVTGEGVLKSLPAPETFINSVLPKEMARYFFFDGEQAETFSSEINYEAVGEAIRNILGCNLAEAGGEDLDYVARQLRKEIGEIPGATELKRVEMEIEARETQQHAKVKRLKELDDEKRKLKEQHENILVRLRATEGVAAIQKQRDTYQKQLDETNAWIKETETEIIRWIGAKSLAVVSERLTKETLDFIDTASLKGRIPSPYNEDFVKGLLASETCVCTRPLKPGTNEYSAVAQLLKNASNAELLGRVVRARGRIQALKESREEAPSTLSGLQKRQGEFLQRRAELEQQIGELSSKIGQLPLTEIAEREQARQKILQRSSEIDQILGKESHDLKIIESEIANKRSELEKLAAQNTKAKPLQQRLDLVQRAQKLLEGLLSEYEKNAKIQIQEYVNEVLEKTARKDYKIKIDDDFSLHLLFSDGRPTPKSSGENQLMSLAFIASLIRFSNERVEDSSTKILIPGAVAPLVLDSPFGQLDNEYRVSTAEFVPKMASQVVLLVSSSQGDDRVLEKLRPHVGIEYILIAENRGPRGEKPSDKIVVGNRSYNASLYNCERTMTRIERAQ